MKNTHDANSHQSKIKKFKVFGFFINFQNVMRAAILISTSENNATL